MGYGRRREVLKHLEGFVASAEIFDRYIEWAHETRLQSRQQIGKRTLTARLKDRGFQHTNHPARGFVGLQLKGGTAGGV